MIDAARNAVPEARFSAILDCGDDAGATQGAIRAGIESVVFNGPKDVAERLASIAAQTGARVLTTRLAEALDLGQWFFADAATLRRHCVAWLASLRSIC
jgi:hypothetical protein